MSDETTNTDVSKSTAAGGVDAAREHAQAEQEETGKVEGEGTSTQAFEPAEGTKREAQVSTDGEAPGNTASDDAGAAAPEGEGEGATDAGTKDAELASYRITGEAPYTDEHGNPQGNLEVGSTQELPVAVGDDFVSKGVAEKVEQGGTGSDQA